MSLAEHLRYVASSSLCCCVKALGVSRGLGHPVPFKAPLSVYKSLSVTQVDMEVAFPHLIKSVKRSLLLFHSTMTEFHMWSKKLIVAK